MSRHSSKQGLASEDGQTMVEFALLLPVLLALVLGIIQFGTAFNYWNDLNQMAADGARFAAVNRVPAGTTLAAFIKSQGDTGDLSSKATVTFCWIPDAAAAAHNTAAAGDAVRVTTSYPITIGDIGPLTLANYTLVGKATMRLEATPTVFDAGSKCT